MNKKVKVAILVMYEGEIMNNLDWSIELCSHGKMEYRGSEREKGRR